MNENWKYLVHVAQLVCHILGGETHFPIEVELLTFVFGYKYSLWLLNSGYIYVWPRCLIEIPMMNNFLCKKINN